MVHYNGRGGVFYFRKIVLLKVSHLKNGTVKS